MVFDVPKEDTVKELKEKISFLQEELVRKEKIIEKLKDENAMIMQTAIRNAQKHLEVSAATKKHEE